MYQPSPGQTSTTLIDGADTEEEQRLLGMAIDVARTVCFGAMVASEDAVERRGRGLPR